MATNHKTTQTEALVPVQFRARQALVDDFRAVVEREERTLSQDLRRYMAERVAAARSEEPPAA